MKKKIVITEEKLVQVLREVVLENQELYEFHVDNIFNPIKNLYYGLKGGFKSGYGYEYFKYVSMLRNLAKDLKRLDVPNEKIMKRLLAIKSEVQSPNKNMRQDLKDKIINGIDKAIYHFTNYSKFVDDMITSANNRLQS